MRITFLILALLGACNDETVSGYTDPGVVWALQSIGGTEFPASATLTFPEEGKIAGLAPCNSYFGQQTVPYPWFKAEAIATTRMTCPQIAQEGMFLKVLSEMTLVDASGKTLILSNDAGHEMVFTAE